MSALVEFIEKVVYKGLEHFGRYYSKYRAFVYSNEDPEGLSRLRLVIPGISDQPRQDWAFPANQFSGPSYGAHVIPPEGSMVWVEFEQGDPEEPIWSYGHFGERDVDSMDPRLLKTDNFWFGTPGGYLIEADDDSEELRITDPFGSRIYLNKSGFSVGTAKGKKIFMGDIDKAKYSALLGEEVLELMKETLTELTKLTVVAAGTPSTVPVNAAAFAAIKARLNKMLSKINRLQ